MKLQVGQIWFARDRSGRRWWEPDFPREYTRQRIDFLNGDVVGLWPMDRPEFGRQTVTFNAVKDIEFFQLDPRELPHDGVELDRDALI